jgi:hypothetical protein
MKKPDSFNDVGQSVKIYLIAAILFITVMTIAYLTWRANCT